MCMSFSAGFAVVAPLQWQRILRYKWTEKHESASCHFQKEGMEHVFVDMSLLWAFASIPFPLPEKYHALLLSSWCSPLGLFLLVPLAEVCWCHFCPSTALPLPLFLPASDLSLLCCWLLLCLALQPHFLPFPFILICPALAVFSLSERANNIFFLCLSPVISIPFSSSCSLLLWPHPATFYKISMY